MLALTTESSTTTINYDYDLRCTSGSTTTQKTENISFELKGKTLQLLLQEFHSS